MSIELAFKSAASSALDRLIAGGYKYADAQTPMRLVRAYFGERLPSGREMTPAEIAEASGFLRRFANKIAAKLIAHEGVALISDYGHRASRRVHAEPMLVDAPPTGAPLLRALLCELDADGHNVDPVKLELEKLLRGIRNTEGRRAA